MKQFEEIVRLEKKKKESISCYAISRKRATRPQPFFITTPYFTVTWLVKHRNDDGNKAITYDGNNASMSRGKNDKKRPHFSSSRTRRSCFLLLLSITPLPIRILFHGFSIDNALLIADLYFTSRENLRKGGRRGGGEENFHPRGKIRSDSISRPCREKYPERSKNRGRGSFSSPDDNLR